MSWLYGCGRGSEVNTGDGAAASVPSFSMAGPSLATRGAAKGILYGAAASPTVLSDEPFSRTFAAECSILVTENALKWRDLSAAPGSYDFTAADSLLSFARDHHILFRGHTLISHDTLPAWFEAAAGPENAGQLLRHHISTVVGRYAGKVHSWDVVNEAIEPSDNERNGLRSSSPWYRLLGPGYIAEAFHAAAAADPGAMLVYNENWLEYDTPYCDRKRSSVLKLLRDLKASGVPVHALGIQGHLDGDLMPQYFTPQKFRAFLGEVAALGLKIMITEMDVRDRHLPADPATRDYAVAGMYHDFLSAVLTEPAVIAVVTWGLSDRYTWNSTYYPRSDGFPVRPLPLDQDLQRKQGWGAVAAAFDAASSR